MSITASIVIIVILILRLLLWKVPKRFSYMLWGIVLFRLLCPVSLSSAYSLLNLIKIPVLTNNFALIDSFVSSDNSVLVNNTIMSDNIAMEDNSSLLDNSFAFIDNSTMSDSLTLSEDTIFVNNFTLADYATMDSDNRPQQIQKTEQMVSGLFFIWVLGIIVLFSYSVVSMIRLYRQIGCSVPLRDNIYLADHIPVPFH